MNNRFKKVILRDFGDKNYELVLSELESITLSHVMSDSQDQLESVWANILNISNGDLQRLRDLVALAKIDCRDILIYDQRTL